MYKRLFFGVKFIFLMVAFCFLLFRTFESVFWWCENVESGIILLFIHNVSVDRTAPDIKGQIIAAIICPHLLSSMFFWLHKISRYRHMSYICMCSYIMYVYIYTHTCNKYRNWDCEKAQGINYLQSYLQEITYVNMFGIIVFSLQHLVYAQPMCYNGIGSGTSIYWVFLLGAIKLAHTFSLIYSKSTLGC